MKSTKYILLSIGSVALIVSFYAIFKGDPFFNHIIGIICGASLIFGYFELNKKEN
ncbi:MAG: hypothetical protein NWP87_00080 [Winogradskyella sp.]|nr:hypothetical protein [Winogradskyella sp.]